MSTFKGTSNYIASNDLQLAVNAAIALEKPLLMSKLKFKLKRLPS